MLNGERGISVCVTLRFRDGVCRVCTSVPGGAKSLLVPLIPTKVGIQERLRDVNRLEASSPDKPERQPWIPTFVGMSGHGLVVYCAASRLTECASTIVSVSPSPVMRSGRQRRWKARTTAAMGSSYGPTRAIL